MKFYSLIGLLATASYVCAQTPLTWDQVKARFEAANPNLKAGQLNIQESKAQEITAYLRPNPNFNMSADQITPFTGNPYRPFAALLTGVSVDYLHERQHKRELRLESAKQGTDIAESQQDDLERNLLFNLRTAFVQTLQAQRLLANARQNLDYFNRELAISQERLKAGDIAKVDFDRLALQKVQYEQDLQTAQVNLRTSKITLLMLLNDRTPVDRFDIAGPFAFKEQIPPLEDFHSIALATRPDLKAAMQAVEKAQTDHRLAVANGSTDPTFSANLGRLPPAYVGFSVNIPLRIFDRNQGEKARTQIDIAHAERQEDAQKAQVFSDVDSAYYMVASNIDLLKPYNGPDGYLQTALRIRDTISYSYQQGQAALVDYLDAQRDYRATEVAFINLMGSYLQAVTQLNMAVGREAM